MRSRSRTWRQGRYCCSKNRLDARFSMLSHDLADDTRRLSAFEPKPDESRKDPRASTRVRQRVRTLPALRRDEGIAEYLSRGEGVMTRAEQANVVDCGRTAEREWLTMFQRQKASLAAAPPFGVDECGTPTPI